MERSAAAPPASGWMLPLISREWRHHPWRHAAALLAVALGVALAWSVHLINTSALAEFSAAVRSANGEPDLVLRGPREGFDDALHDAVAAMPGVLLASPVVELESYAASATGTRVALRIVGIDVLRAAPLAPQLVPRPAAGQPDTRTAPLDPDLVFLNPAARERLGVRDGDMLALQSGPQWKRLRVAGSVAAGGTPLVVIDIAGAQEHFGLVGRLTRIDLRLAAGTSAASLQGRWPALPPGVQPVAADDAEQRVSQLSRAYRVNLTVLALVALFVGAFLVYSVVSLSVAQRTPALALLGVLGLTAAERRHLVLAECALLGAAGSMVGLALGSGMAAAALRWLAGDLGGGYFPGIVPDLSWSVGGALLFGALGIVAALVGGFVPARQAQRLQPAQALKGLGASQAHAPVVWPGLALVGAAGGLALLPPVAGLPLAAYASVAALLAGGVMLVPAAVSMLLGVLPGPRSVLGLLALQRALHQRQTASAAVAGVVASLALSVALTVMVASFRDGVARWLDDVLPADLYARTAASSALAEQAWLDPAFVQRVRALPGVARVQPATQRALQLAPGRPTVTLIARDLGDPAAALPLLEPPLPPGTVSAGEMGVYVSEAMVSLYGAAPGQGLKLPLAGREVPARVLGVWRDYARQFGAVVIERGVYVALTGDERLTELALWLAPDAEPAAVQQALRAAAPDPAMLELSTTAELRRLSLRIFDRSFAVTVYLQAVAIGIGLVGIAASLSAQVLARRKEFGLLAHLGLTRRQVLLLVCAESAAWLAAGVVVGLLLGLAISVVLVHVVNPQSFHWTMELRLPAGRLLALCAAVLVAGIATAAISARAAASRAAVLAVKEDW